MTYRPSPIQIWCWLHKTSNSFRKAISKKARRSWWHNHPIVNVKQGLKIRMRSEWSWMRYLRPMRKLSSLNRLLLSLMSRILWMLLKSGREKQKCSSCRDKQRIWLRNRRTLKKTSEMMPLYLAIIITQWSFNKSKNTFSNSKSKSKSSTRVRSRIYSKDSQWNNSFMKIINRLNRSGHQSIRELSTPMWKTIWS